MGPKRASSAFWPRFRFIDMPSLGVTVPQWGWLWTLSGTGGVNHGLTLTAERSQPNVAVTLSEQPLRTWLTYRTEF